MAAESSDPVCHPTKTAVLPPNKVCGSTPGLHLAVCCRRRDAHAPCFYLHLEPGNCFAAAGIWHPEPAVAQQVRVAIAASLPASTSRRAMVNVGIRSTTAR